VVHVHGALAAANSTGAPDAEVASERIFIYPNRQRAATLWSASVCSYDMRAYRLWASPSPAFPCCAATGTMTWRWGCRGSTCRRASLVYISSMSVP